MKFNYIFYGLIEIVFSILFVVITLRLGFLIFSWFTRDYDDTKEIKENNIAVGIITAAFLVCMGIALNIASGPARSTLRNIISRENFQVMMLLTGLGLMLLQLVIAAVVSILSVCFTIILLAKISPVTSLKSVMNKNIAAAIIISAVMLITMLLIGDPLLFLLEGLIPRTAL